MRDLLAASAHAGQRAANAATATLGANMRTSGTFTGGGVAAAPNVRVYIGDRELTDIVRVEHDARDAVLADALIYQGI